MTTNGNSQSEVGKTGGLLFKRGGFFDRSACGRLELKGKDSLDLLHRISTNDLKGMGEGEILGTVLTTEKGRIVDYVKVLRLNDSLLLITSQGTGSRVKKWIDKFCVMEDVHVLDVTSSTAMYSMLLLEGNPTIENLPEAASWQNTFRKVGSPSFSYIVANDADFGVGLLHVIADLPYGERVRELLKTLFEELDPDLFEVYRISRGMPAIEGELSEAFNPYEAGLGQAVSLTKGCYVGQEVLARITLHGMADRRILMGLLFKESANVGEKRPTLFKNSQEVGWRTSSSSRSVNGQFLGLGIVTSSQVHAGDTVWVASPEVKIEATVQNLPLLAEGE